MITMVNTSIAYQDKKPVLHKIACYLGFIFVSLTVLTGLMLILVSTTPGIFRMFPEINFYVSIASGKISLGYALMTLILSMISFFGIIQLWHQLKIGFWIFLGAKVLFILLPFLFIDLSLQELWLFVQPLIILTIALIILFGLNYKKMY